MGGRHQTESLHQRWTVVKQDWSDPEYRVILVSTKHRGGIDGTKETDHEKVQRNPAREVEDGILRPAGGCQFANLPQHSGGL